MHIFHYTSSGCSQFNINEFHRFSLPPLVYVSELFGLDSCLYVCVCVFNLCKEEKGRTSNNRKKKDRERQETPV